MMAAKARKYDGFSGRGIIISDQAGLNAPARSSGGSVLTSRHASWRDIIFEQFYLPHLKLGLSIALIFVGAKMPLTGVYKIPVAASAGRQRSGAADRRVARFSESVSHESGARLVADFWMRTRVRKARRCGAALKSKGIRSNLQDKLFRNQDSFLPKYLFIGYNQKGSKRANRTPLCAS